MGEPEIDSIGAFIVLAICWSISFEFAVVAGLAWAIAGISQSNAYHRGNET